MDFDRAVGRPVRTERQLKKQRYKEFVNKETRSLILLKTLRIATAGTNKIQVPYTREQDTKLEKYIETLQGADLDALLARCEQENGKEKENISGLPVVTEQTEDDESYKNSVFYTPKDVKAANRKVINDYVKIPDSYFSRE